MNRSFRIAMLLSLLLVGVTHSTAQCLYDNAGKKLTRKQRQKVKADAPVIQAIETRNINALESALKVGVDVNARDCESGTTALILTVIIDNPQMMRFLISKKAKINLQNNSGFTALMYAVGWGRIDVVKELIAAGANVNLRTKEGDRVTALGMALRYSDKAMEEIANILRANGATK